MALTTRTADLMVSLWGPTDENEVLTTVIFLTLLPLSLLSSAFIVVTYGAFRRQLAKPGSDFVVWLSISDFMFSLRILVQFLFLSFDYFRNLVKNYSDLCLGMAMFGQFSFSATISWNMMMSVRLLASFMRIKQLSHSSYNYSQASWASRTLHSATWPYHLYAWGISLINTTIIYLIGGYSMADQVCFIQNSFVPRMFYIVPLFTHLFLCLAILLYILHRMKREGTKLHLPSSMEAIFRKEEKRFRRQMIKFTLVFVLLWLLPLTDRILDLVGIENYWLTMIDLACVTLQAFANSLVWGTSPHFIQFVRDKLRPKTHEHESLVFSQ
eukprot:TRINITY_DN8985_c0_g1_i1.p1 TRINITY_DN8985_c0_g1~~TRINITY_DN8985_c0_g1_i1.p1  ORF type:complete len:326 (+),score=67.95 TRINITY_DN8985_c0_g1_i1:206-1183(+)